MALAISSLAPTASAQEARSSTSDMRASSSGPQDPGRAAPPSGATGNGQDPDGPDRSKRSGDEEPARTSEILVVAPAAQDYLVPETSVATRGETPVRELPFSVSTLSRQLIEDVAARSLSDVTRYTPSLEFENIGGFLGAADASFLRGFRNRFLYYDGFLLEAIPSVNPSTLERIEVLRGPSSVLYGAMEPGGLINVVSKGATERPFVEVRDRIGSWRYHEATFDAGAPVPGAEGLFVRVNGGFRNNESFRQSFEDDRQWVAPSLLWRPSEDVEIDARISYGEQKRVIDEGVAFTALGERVADPDIFLGEPGFPGQRYDQLLGQLRAKVRVAEDVTYRTGFLASYWSNAMSGVRRSAPTNADNTVNRLFEESDFSQDSYQWINQVQWDLDLGPTAHSLQFGIDMRRRSSDLDLRRGGFPATSITNPVYGNPAPPISTSVDLRQDQDWLSIFLQDQIDLLDDRLHVNLAGRYDWVRQENASSPTNSSESDDQAFTGRVGALYDLTRTLGAYVSYGESFVPQSPGTTNAAGERLDPEIGEQIEAGFKKSWMDERFLTTLAFYQLTKQDVAISDVLNPGFSVNAGKLRSQGVEFEAVGEVVDDLSLIVTYAYTDTEVLRSTSLPLGARFRNIPEHSGSVWMKYVFDETSSPLDGFGLGAGLRAVSDRKGDDQGSFELAPYWTTDLALYYSRGPVDFQLNVVNVFDTSYYESSLATSRVFPGSPQAIYATFGLTF